MAATRRFALLIRAWQHLFPACRKGPTRPIICLPRGCDGTSPNNQNRKEWNMNTCMKKLFLVPAALAAMWLGGDVGLAATLTVTPSVTSNTYSGVITLNITGVTNGEKVTVETYLDLNANGSIDPGEPMMDTFKITDGGAMIIGGITNINVPF